jgi:hypothetical protein
MNQATIIGAGLLVYLLWREKQKAQAEPPVNVTSSPNVVVEDDTAEALRDLAKILISQDPNRYVTFDFLGKGIDAQFFSRPMLERLPIVQPWSPKLP